MIVIVASISIVMSIIVVIIIVIIIIIDAPDRKRCVHKLYSRRCI